MPEFDIDGLRQAPEFRACILQFKRVEPWAVVPLLKQVDQILCKHGRYGNASCEVRVRIELRNKAEEQELDRIVLAPNEEQITVDDMDWEEFEGPS
jgi:hypothetical protein